MGIGWVAFWHGLRHVWYDKTEGGSFAQRLEVYTFSASTLATP